jgi:hypothetical protein
MGTLTFYSAQRAVTLKKSVFWDKVRFVFDIHGLFHKSASVNADFDT